MDLSKHTMSCLFAQLGISNNAVDIEHFIKNNRGIPADVYLADATIWNNAQANFLHDAIKEDADWAEVVDNLDSLLR